MREFSFQAILLGIVIGALLAAANVFIGLKVGMTISASVPAAVMSLLILKTLLKRGTILESNMVQTIGSAGESVAAGMIFTLPALFIMGQETSWLEMVIWGALGGILGVCFMVPLRRVLIVKERDTLPYPEGVACAEVLESGERGGAAAKSVIYGAIVGGVYYLFGALGAWTESATAPIRRLRTEFQLESSPALLGVGYILGIRVAAYMLAGAILSWFVLIPAVGFFGADSVASVYPAKAGELISAMSPDDIHQNYIRYIGAGAVAIGGLISLFKSIPTILSSLWHVLTGIFGAGKGGRDRTDKDFPFILLLIIVGGIAYLMWQIPAVKVGPVGAIAVVVFAFFFVTVSSRLVGLVGSSSNPVSGMTIATLLATALVYKFFVMDQAAPGEVIDVDNLKVICLSVGAIVCVAISVAGDCSQDLKTGYLVKATPYKQQVGEMIGVLTSVLVIAGVILLLNESQGFVETPDHPHPILAPQANIMKILVEGVLGGTVPWELILMGGAMAVIIEMLGLPALPFAVGMYLPLGLSTPIMVGGIIRWMIERKKKEHSEHDPGVLTAAGLVAGKGIMGVALAGVTVLIAWWWDSPRWTSPLESADSPVTPAHLIPWTWSKIDALPDRWGLSENRWAALSMFPFALLVVWFWWCARKRPRISLPPATAVPSGPLDAPPTPFVPEPPIPLVEEPTAHTREEVTDTERVLFRLQGDSASDADQDNDELAGQVGFDATDDPPVIFGEEPGESESSGDDPKQTDEQDKPL